MRLIDDVSREALEGSRPADSLTVWAWRDGSLVVSEPLEIIDWSEQDDARDSDKVNRKMGFLIADPDATLGAWRFDDPLGVAGTELRIIYQVGGAGPVNFAVLRVIRNEPAEVVDSRTIAEYGLFVPDSLDAPHERRRYVTGGTVFIEAVDLTFNVDRDRFEVPESPPAGATVQSEFRRLTRDHFPTVVDPGVKNRAVSSKTVWDRERLEACQDVLALVGARYRMGGDGECHLYDPVSAPVWRVEPTAGLVSVSRKQSLDGLYNRWVVEGKEQDDGQPVRGVASVEMGPLRWGGPHGKAPYFYSSEMIATYSDAVAYAAELRDKFLASLAVELTVEIVPRPELQAGDRIEVGCPVTAGHVAYLPGSITSIRRNGGTVPKGTTLTVSCSYADVVTALTRTEWAQHITLQAPELTWDRMPGTWGQLPAVTWDSLP